MKQHKKLIRSFLKGSEYRYAWPDTIRIKGSVCQANGVDLIT